jgi:preprotein translocase subunit SecF
MELIKPGINIDFIGKRNIAFAVSALFILATLVLLVWRGGPNYGVDFTGGVVIQVKLEKEHSLSEIRTALEPIRLSDSIIQEFGEKDAHEYMIRVTNPEVQAAGLGGEVSEALAAKFGEDVDIRQVEMVGPQVGQDLRQKALMAIFFSILLIAVYISGRFEMKWLMSIVMALVLASAVYVASLFGAGVTLLILIALVVMVGFCWFLNLKYAMGAIVALIHDVIITVGAFALLNKEISLPIVAALLTIAGYSLNDTIVVFDRIRENISRFRKKSLEEILNASINQTLSRTILTGVTTLIVLLALFFLGGTVIHDFAFALIVGIVVGTYSSIYVASPVLLLWEARSSQAGQGKKNPH